MRKLLTTTALVLSLASAGVASANTDGHKGHHDGPPFMQEALAKLPADKAAAFRDTMKQSREQNKGSFEQLHKLHKEMQAILTASSFDKNAYLAKSAESAAAAGQDARCQEPELCRRGKQPSQDERKTLADAFHKGRHHSKGKHDGDQPNADSPPQ